MKMLLTIIVLAIGFSAHAIEIYNCDVTADPKIGDPYSFTKKLFISKDFTNQTDFHKTDLKLTVRNGKLDGFVNGQPNHILKGTPENGYFESAYHVGSVSCSKPVATAYMLQFKPWKQYYTLDENLSVGHILSSVNTASFYHNNICFIGDANAAAEAISSNASIKTKVLDRYQVQLTFDYTSCVRGTGSYDSFECDEYKTETVKKTILDCINGDGTWDPRS